MTESSSQTSNWTGATPRTLIRTILIVDPDPIFRMGLRLTLEKLTQLQVLEATAAGASLTMAQQFASDWSQDTGAPDLGLVVMEPGLRLTEYPPAPYLWQQFKQQYPKLPVLLLGNPLDPSLFALARRLGVEGYSPKGIATEAMASIVLRLVAGERFWPADIQRLAMDAEPADIPTLPLSSSRLPGPTAAGAPARMASTQLPLLQRWRHGLLANGLEEIAADLALLQIQLEHPDLSWLNRRLIEGRLREMRCAYWLVQQALPAATKETFTLTQPSKVSQPTAQQPKARQPTAQQSARPATTQGAFSITQATLPSLATTTSPSLAHIPTVLLETLQTKADFNLSNRSALALEIEILRPERRQELVSIVLKRFKTLLIDLQTAGVTAPQLRERRSQILLDLWQDSLTDFYGRYTLAPTAATDTAAAVSPVNSATNSVTNTTQPGLGSMGLVASLLQEQATVQTSLLEPIPLVNELLEHLLLAMPLRIDNSNHAPGTVAAMRRAEALLTHLVLQVANGVVQPLLNRYADQEWIKQEYYDQQVMSSREIERFRNRLSWQYRLQELWVEPQAIFESRVSLLTLDERGIELQSIYTPRQQELEQLHGFRALVTLTLEFRDAVAPPLRAVVTFVGKGLIYLLTQVIGRGLGLIGRGILQGIGSSWQEAQLGRRQTPPR
jgi:DNA-binding NarL/FixJ family response regulator